MTGRMLCCAALAALTILPRSTALANDDSVYPLALFPFQQRGQDQSELGKQVTDLLFARLAENPHLYLVEREDLTKIIKEQELNVSGLVSPDSAVKIGQLTGAKILIAGTVLEVNDNLYLVAKVLGSETSRVLGASVKGKVDGDMDKLVKELANKVGKTIKDRADELVAHPLARVDRIAALKKRVGPGKRPSVVIQVQERHVGQTTIDPAVATELALYCIELGFTVIDSQTGSKKDADILLVGEGISEFAARHGNLVTVKARLELKAVERKSDKVVAIDREVAIGVDLTEQIAAKSSLQNAAANIASRLLPRLIDSKQKKKRD